MGNTVQMAGGDTYPQDHSVLVMTIQVCSWLARWMDGWMDGWMDLTAVLSIVHSNQK